MVKVILWAFFILPWLSVFLMDRSAIRRYMPVALFATVLNTIAYQIAWTYNWWQYKITLFAWDKVAQIHTVYGVFLVGTLWIFHYTFRKFWVYMLVNLGTDLIYAYGFRTLWKILGVTAPQGIMPPIGSVIIMTGFALLLYAYQMWQEGIWGAGGRHPEGRRFLGEHGALAVPPMRRSKGEKAK
ncbi:MULTISPECIES: hypothetical protein [Paenibacillus]|uniref:hypothetical protein n=1 Tax=Paenibacillus TaxID=44249 RepID=UPI0022B85A54|nr:hypothetical protein [Paenibacillus caseinilyticus]MCZ8520366.1 hypothetical protein [Paenibacillus caseinilyticus]